MKNDNVLISTQGLSKIRKNYSKLQNLVVQTPMIFVSPQTVAKNGRRRRFEKEKDKGETYHKD